MENKNYLNEKKYHKTEKVITIIAILILIISLSIGALLIYKGVSGSNGSKLDDLTAELETKKNELISKGIKYNSSAKYDDGEAYELKVITKALDPSFDNCAFDEYKNNVITKEYCAIRNKNSSFSKMAFIMFGAFICMASCIISFNIFTFAKKRHLIAFKTQQVMPVVKEGIDEIAPTVGNALGEITKGIQNGLKDDEK